MLIGVPKEIKQDENRVGLTPASVRELVRQGHGVLVEKGAGERIGFEDSSYVGAGARIADSADVLFAQSELIVKVKEPQQAECKRLREGQVLFTYLHLAADRPQAEALMGSGCTAIAYETVTDRNGRLPLLAPMSEIAGRMAIQVGAVALQLRNGGSGVLLGGVPGVLPGKVLVLGGGVAGTNAARMALGLGAEVTVLDKSVSRLTELDAIYGPRLKTAYATAEAIETLIVDANLVVGAALIAGAAAPKLIRRQQLSRMTRGAVLVDISIDQGGCFETSHATTHAEPTYAVDGIVHYCVANMPGAVARTSTQALNQATLPFVAVLARKGWRQAMIDDPGLLGGLNVHAGRLTHRAAAEALGLEAIEPARCLH